jgi:hypothetical protein
VRGLLQQSTAPLCPAGDALKSTKGHHTTTTATTTTTTTTFLFFNAAPASASTPATCSSQSITNTTPSHFENTTGFRL